MGNHLFETWSFSLATVAAAVLVLTASPGEAQEYGSDAQKDSDDAAPGAVSPLDQFGEALFGGRFKIDMRYRFERVSQEGIGRDALASVLRTRFGYETGKFHGFQVYLEGENLAHLGNDRFNDTVNGLAGRFPTVADPDTTELNQGYLDYMGILDTKIRGGRFRLKLDNDRFIGNVGFRQNEQTFDGALLWNSTLPHTKFLYGYLGNANRIFGDDSAAGDFLQDSHLARLEYSWYDFATFAIYNYYLRFQDPATQRFSNNSTGIRIWGKNPLPWIDDLTFTYAAEYAHQVEVTNNPTNFDLDYYIINPGLKYGNWTLKAAAEVLGSDGVSAFQTPLATGHAHQGETDQFVVIPAQGLIDTFGKISYGFKDSGSWEGILDNVTVWAMYHDFEAEDDGSDFGQEVSTAINKRFDDVTPWGGRIWIEFRYAHLNSDTDDAARSDIDMMWATFRFNY